MVRQDDPGVNMKRCAGFNPADRFAQDIDMLHEECVAAVMQVDGEEICAAGEPVAPVCRHAG